MKKLTLFLTTLIVLAACSKSSDNLLAEEKKEKFLSKVQRYKDGRSPGVDTVWTLRLFNQQMVDSFAKYDGYIYLETNTLTEVGVIWSK